MSLTGLNTRGHQQRKSYKRTPEDAWIIEKRVTRELLGPSLPNLDGVSWHVQTREWYNAVRRSDIASVYTESEWQSLIDAALLKNAIISGVGRNGKVIGHRDFQGYQAELRQQMNGLLLTPESRKRNKVIFVGPEPKEPAGPASSSVNYRQRLGQDLDALFSGEEVVDVHG